MMRNLYNKTISYLDRFFETDSAYLISGGGWAFISKITTSLLLLGLSVMYARFLDKELYGSYRYVLSFLSMGGFLLLPGLFTSYFRAMAQGHLNLFSKASKIKFITSLPLSVFSVGLSIYFFIFQQNPTFGTAFLVTGILLPLIEGTGAYINLLTLQKQFKKKTLYSILEHVFFGIMMAIVVFLIYVKSIHSTAALSLMLAAMYFGHGIPKIIFLFITLRGTPKNQTSLETNEQKEIVRYGLHLSASSIITPIATNLDKVLLGSLLGPSALAVYSFALLVPEQIRGLILVFQSSAVAKILSKKSKDLSFLPKKLLRASLFIVPIVVLYYLSAPYIYSFLFPQYNDSVQYSQIAAFSLIAIPLTSLASALVSTKRTKKIYAHRITGSLVQTTLFLILLPLFGIWGAIWSRVFGRFLNVALLWVLFKKK